MKNISTSAKKNSRNIGLSAKLTLGAMVINGAMLAAIGITLYFFMSNRIEQDARDRLKLAVVSAKQMIDQSVSHTVQSQLKATADRNLEIVAHFYKQFKKGKLTEDQAKELAKQTLLSQQIGKTGYMYVVDSTGTLRVHPKEKLVNVNISKHKFVQEQIARKTGYLEYDWKNPGETKHRPKSLSMTYFKPWDYIISASAYREEFLSLIHLEEFKKDFENIKLGKSGYVYVIDTKGTLLIHPKLEGIDISNYQDTEGRYFIKEMCAKKSGAISYPWKNPGEDTARIKDVEFTHYPVLDIIVAGGIYREELYAPLTDLRNSIIVILIIMIVITLPLAYFAARAVANPVLKLSRLSRTIAAKDLRVINDFDNLEASEQKGYTRFTRGSYEIITLLCSFREAGVSIRNLVANLSSNAQKLSTQASIIKKAARHSSNSAADQSTIVEEVSQTIESLLNTFTRTEKIANDVYTVSEQAVRKGAEGNAAVKGAQTSMKTIIATTDAARTQMTSLDDLSNQIAQVVKSLEQIANKSQMLAINASIEAAEAGETGKGFAVVAQEVQELAIQSAQSTQNIRSFLQQIADTASKAIKITEDSQIAVTQGQSSISGMEKVLHSLTQVLDSNNQHADQISRTVAEQSSAISQISYAVTHVLENSQKGTMNGGKLLAAVNELNRTRAEFERLVSEYAV